MTTTNIPKDPARTLFERLDREAKQGGYLLNPDTDFVMDLMDGLVINRERYGYLACPCRDADGVRARDLDLICPCDYRDPDLDEYGTCYCALYVSDAVVKGERKLGTIPDRRPVAAERERTSTPGAHRAPFTGGQPIWRCKVCGYLAARPEPPLKCPVCTADQDRFEPFP